MYVTIFLKDVCSARLSKRRLPHSQKELDRKQGQRHEEKEYFEGFVKAQEADFHKEEIG